MRIPFIMSLLTIFHKREKSEDRPSGPTDREINPPLSRAEKKQQKRRQKRSRRVEKQNKQNTLRQKDPEGLLKIALKPSPRRKSLTAADPARFYKKESSWTDHLASEGIEVRDWARNSATRSDKADL